jgi:phosphatidylglycerophosphate synthase
MAGETSRCIRRPWAIDGRRRSVATPDGVGRYLLLLMLSVGAPGRFSGRQRAGKAGHGRPAATSKARYAIAALLNCAVVSLFVALAARRLQPHRRILTGANLLSLSRAWGAGLLAGTAATPPLGRGTAWLALLWGGPSDWLDGPLARLDGATALGAILDIEADSWLTLWAAVAAWRLGALPSWSVLSPLLRYLIPGVQAQLKGHRPVDRPWQRTAAGLQTLVLALALVPMCPLNRIGRALAPLGGLAQTAAMLQTIGDLVHAAASSSSGQPIRSRFSPTFTCENGAW